MSLKPIQKKKLRQKKMRMKPIPRISWFEKEEYNPVLMSNNDNIMSCLLNLYSVTKNP